MSNLDLLQQLDALLQVRKTTFVHVRAHTGGKDVDSTCNAIADRLATEACQVKPGGNVDCSRLTTDL